MLVASGTGLAPFMSMIETLRDRGQTRDLVLLNKSVTGADKAWNLVVPDLLDLKLLAPKA